MNVRPLQLIAARLGKSCVTVTFSYELLKSDEKTKVITVLMYCPEPMGAY